MNITFERGIFTIEQDNKKYLVNLNTKTIINAKTQRTLQRIAISQADFSECMRKSNELSNPMFYAVSRLASFEYGKMWNEDNLCRLAILEKFVNLGCNYNNKYELWNFCQSRQTEKDISLAIRCINKRKKENNNIDMRDIMDDMYIETLALNNPKADKEFLYNHINELKNMGIEPTYTNLDIYLYYCYTQKLHIIFGFGTLSSYLRDYVKMCKLIGKAPIKTSNFAREYIETKATYTRLKEVYDKEQFARVHDKLMQKAFFETDEFTVVVPQEPKDLIMEGEKMHHCVGGYVDRVLNEETYIVFIRKKSQVDIPYITCQIYLNGQIGQYYMAYDHYISEDKDIQFKRQSQAFLAQHWND